MRSHFLTPFHIAFFCVAIAAPSALLGDSDDGSSHQQVLTRHGIKADATGIATLLKKVANADSSAERVNQLITELGNEDFQKRESAMQALRRMPVLPFKALQTASEHKDAEIAFRAQALLKIARLSGPSETVVAAIEISRIRKLRGVALPLLVAVPNIESGLQDQAIAAIKACATQSDRPALRKALADEMPLVRRAAVAGLSSFAKDGSLERISPLIKDQDLQVRFDAALTCLNGGQRNALAVFVDLLANDDIELRAKAVSILRSVSGKQFEFIAYDTDEKRNDAVKKWRDWLKSESATAKLNIPVPTHPAFVGRIIVAGYTAGTIVELNLQGKVLRDYRIPGMSYPWGAQRLPNGNTLITWYSNKFVAEYDRDNKEVWRYNVNGYPWKALRLENGNTLITEGSNAIEVNRQGKKIWSHLFTAGSLTDVARLPNGNTLALTNSQAVEVTREGRVIWQVTGISNGYRIQRLPNGNTLIAEKGRNQLVEFNREKQRVWTFNKVRTPDCVQRLPDGRLLVSGGGGVHLFSKSGELLWKHILTGQSVARFY